ncbi:sensor histidine kinase [Microbacterium sp.]|uniref:sensor histidine kinase n=1 Tax=Microbacterium sp. TaxID=51671 RepID=UPI003C763D01
MSTGAAPRTSRAEGARADPRGVVAWVIVGLSAASWVAVLFIADPPDAWVFAPWMLMYISPIAVTAIVLLRRPSHPLAVWLALGAVLPVFEVIIWVVRRGLDSGMAPSALALWNAAQGSITVLVGISVAHVLAEFPGSPDGDARPRHERITLRAVWCAFLVPLAVLLCSPVVVFPFYVVVASPVPNPFVTGVTLDPLLLAVAQETVSAMAVVTGAVLLMLRYRRSPRHERRPMRWLLVPVGLLPVPLVTQAVAFEAANLVVSLAWALLGVSFSLAIGLGLLQPTGLSADRALRKTVVYGLLWVVITVAYAAVAAIVGTAAGALLPVEAAVVLAVLVAIAFQPVRTVLQRLADRRVFGERPDPAQLVVGLGRSLEGTYDLDSLLPRMSTVLEEGMRLEWARVRLTPGEPAATDAALVVPVEVDGERVAVIECGPRRDGKLGPAEVAIIENFARQAAMAVRNVRLRALLVAQTELLAESRARLVRAQEQERRRIERNIHDGVQQDLTALIGLVGQARHELPPHATVADDLMALQAGLERVLADVRALAQGIHPSMLSDRGLLAAVEALSARHPVPVVVRADAGVRELRPREDVEGAAYFTIAEALANALKHASAQQISVALRLREERLHIKVSDDGAGFDPDDTNGSGLANLSARVVAVGGRLVVTSDPGSGTTLTAMFPLSEQEVMA